MSGIIIIKMDSYHDVKANSISPRMNELERRFGTSENL